MNRSGDGALFLPEMETHPTFAQTLETWMLEAVQSLWEGLMTWPTLPFTILLAIVTGYWLFVTLGFLAFDAIDLDFDFDVDSPDFDADITGHASVLDLGLVPLRWLNIGSVPLMIWGTVFTLVAWAVSRWANAEIAHDDFRWMSDLQVIARDGVIAAIITKFTTNPMRGMFDFEEPNRPETLIGEVATVTTSEITDVFGEVELATEGAPLKLKARRHEPIADDASLTKGDWAQLLSYDQEADIYRVAPAPEQLIKQIQNTHVTPVDIVKQDKHDH